ncbi:MAG: phosphopantetheine adenylyltransferase [Methanosphaera sp.]|uniref:phosphopantetheine adenylyltransferase n=1 Tax=Methanosphaera sp. TaxID=2666342 RepID=UPI0025CF55E3|nr:phosphopantetheine adenylyltransferase [Methanosphaera sp.]MCI5866572.1 phosphopantetheine adenylyltransferase [Methanosphaera sp.]MDD6535049.1 phosphopantetheine adenylyltransferase [Methanosphaera sp.]MDY3955481.1 phosphopantetheine adenylyltransferase [Methanosphaera sp.]
MDYTYNKIAVGGTFDKFHKGHEQLIKTAFDMAENVLIGVSSDAFASRKSHNVECCEKRIKNVKEAIKDYDNNYTIIEINDAMGTADIDANLDAIVVSEETEESAVYINKIRHENGLKLLDIVVIKWVLADDNIPISSTRIRKGEITQDGVIISD